VVSWLGIMGCCVGNGGWQEAERAYLLWKARQVADQQGSGAITVRGREGDVTTAILDFAVHELKGDLFPELMEYMWGGEYPRGAIIPVAKPRAGVTVWARSLATGVARHVIWVLQSRAC
jgi:hypothetical protein